MCLARGLWPHPTDAEARPTGQGAAPAVGTIGWHIWPASSWIRLGVKDSFCDFGMNLSQVSN